MSGKYLIVPDVLPGVWKSIISTPCTVCLSLDFENNLNICEKLMFFYLLCNIYNIYIYIIYSQQSLAINRFCRKLHL